MSGANIVEHTIKIAGHEAPFGTDMLFRSTGNVPVTFHVEICEDIWVPVPPSSHAALAGAEVLVNLSASNITIGKAEARRLLCGSQSARAIAAYAYSASGPGESTTDLAWDGHAAIYELRRPARRDDALREGLAPSSRPTSISAASARSGCATTASPTAP